MSTLFIFQVSCSDSGVVDSLGTYTSTWCICVWMQMYVHVHWVWMVRTTVFWPAPCGGEARRCWGQPDVAGRGRRAAGFPAFLQENVVLSTWNQSSKISHIFLRLPIEFGVIPGRFLFLQISLIFNGWKIKKKYFPTLKNSGKINKGGLDFCQPLCKISAQNTKKWIF
jgi:hypothetical protein